MPLDGLPEDRRLRRTAPPRSQQEQEDRRTWRRDMPAMMNAVPGSGVVTNNVANGMLKDPGAMKVFMSSWSNFNSRAPAPTAGTARCPGAVLRAHGHQPVGDDAVRRRGAALRSTRPRAGRWSPTWARGTPTPRIQQGAVRHCGHEAGRDRGDVAAGRKAQGQGFPNLFDYLSSGVQGSRDRQVPPPRWSSPSPRPR